MAGMNHYMGDLYPNMGYLRTDISTVAEPEDQTALVDNQKLANNSVDPKSKNPEGHKNILIGIGILLVVGVVMGAIKI